jgi:CHAD domain-containing protein
MKREPSIELLRRRINRVLRFLPMATHGDPEAVHDARVATRRLREALPVIAPGKKGRALLRSARRITRALGPVRELDVALTTLVEFGTSTGVRPASIALVRTAIAEERQGLCARTPRRVKRDDLKALGARAVEEMVAPPSQRRARALAAEAEARGARKAIRLRAAIENAAGIYLPDRLHEVRIGVKKLRYAMELVRELRNARTPSRRVTSTVSTRTATARLRILRQAQELLGCMHDLEMLAARVRALQGTARVTGLQVSADLDQLIRRLEHECRDLHGRYMASRRRLLAVCGAAEALSRRHRPVHRAV